MKLMAPVAGAGKAGSEYSRLEGFSPVAAKLIPTGPVPPGVPRGARLREGWPVPVAVDRQGLSTEFPGGSALGRPCWRRCTAGGPPCRRRDDPVPGHPGCRRSPAPRGVPPGALVINEFTGCFSRSVIAIPGGALGRRGRDGTPSTQGVPDGVGRSAPTLRAGTRGRPAAGRASRRASVPARSLRSWSAQAASEAAAGPVPGDRTRRPRTARLLGHPQGRHQGRINLAAMGLKEAISPGSMPSGKAPEEEAGSRIVLA